MTVFASGHRTLGPKSQFYLSGAFFLECWKRENARLAFEFDVENFEENEPDLPEYTRRIEKLKKKIKNSNAVVKFLAEYITQFKYLVSLLILLFMVSQG